jgi:flagellar basal-body rod modification protein FlgD
MTTAVTNTATTGSTPATGTSADILAGQQNLSTSYTTFLSLLTTQLKNQDPTSPLDPNQFTQQLVQMTGVQQQLLSNQLLQQLVTQSSGGQGVSGAVGLIGKTVDAESPTATVAGGKAAWSYSLDKAASAATLTVTDSTGQAVWTGSAPDLSAGTHAFTWNGKTASGAQASDGSTYTLSIKAADATGAAVTSDVLISGVVSSATNTAGKVTLKIGDSTAPLSAVVGVHGS